MVSDTAAADRPSRSTRRARIGTTPSSSMERIDSRYSSVVSCISATDLRPDDGAALVREIEARCQRDETSSDSATRLGIRCSPLSVVTVTSPHADACSRSSRSARARACSRPRSRRRRGSVLAVEIDPALAAGLARRFAAAAERHRAPRRRAATSRCRSIRTGSSPTRRSRAPRRSCAGCSTIRPAAWCGPTWWSSGRSPATGRRVSERRARRPARRDLGALVAVRPRAAASPRPASVPGPACDAAVPVITRAAPARAHGDRAPTSRATRPS